MDVREKLVELIEKASYECDEGTRDLWDMRQVADGIADFLIANGTTIPEWISVKDRLPEEEGLYLVAVVNDHERRYSKTAWYHGREKWFSNQKVTHWKPLPQPPKGE